MGNIKNDLTRDLTRDDFMTFFRDDMKLNLLSPDDRIEIFSQILLGSTDLTTELLNSILNDYSVSNISVISRENGEK